MKVPYDRSQIIPHKLFCYRCGDTGKLLASKNGESSLPYAFRCDCQRGQMIRVSFPRWTVFSEKTFTIITGIQGAEP